MLVAVRFGKTALRSHHMRLQNAELSATCQIWHTHHLGSPSWDIDSFPFLVYRSGTFSCRFKYLLLFLHRLGLDLSRKTKAEKHVHLWLVLWRSSFSGSMAERREDSVFGSRQCRKDHTSSHAQRWGWCALRGIYLPLAFVFGFSGAEKWDLDSVFAEISSTSADSTPHFRGIEHWEDQVQGFRFGWSSSCSQSLERLLCKGQSHSV